ncbi:MAG TPA: cell surface protein SprA [Gemmatimonadales bacterium]|nr:cell surface protein SprA [Gemmatimonadales bacterium]
MRLHAQLVLLAATLVVPQVHAQAPVYTFGVPPLVAPRNPALAPGGRLGARVPPALLAHAWAAGVLARRLPLFGPQNTSAAVATPSPVNAPGGVPSVGVAAGEHRGVFGQYADLAMQLNLRFELKADQFRNLRCTSQERQLAISGCSAGFPTISPNPQYAIRTAGIVGQRLHVDVDFDSQREFDANNNLHVWYEGLEDEVLRRVEAGNVTFQAPPSRFITAAIPANNFGIQAIAQLGPVEFRGILAQQKGNVVQDRFYTVGAVTSQPLDRLARDLDYETGRFFFAIDPAALPRYPAIDILQLDQVPRPDSLTVGALRVFRRRAVAPTSNGNQNAGGVRAVACGPARKAIDCTVQREGPFDWETLQEGKDYYVDPSGTWFALANRLDQSDYLAVSYISASRLDSVGTFPVDANPDTSKVDTLRLVYDPKPGVTAASPSFRFEIRSTYRVGGREIDRSSLAVALSVNQRERSAAGDTYLARLGLALANDPTTFDQYNRLFPRARDPNQGDPVRDQFIVFPHLTPLADSTKLTAVERNDSLYRTPRTYLATQGPPSVFAVRIHVDANASADRSVLSLNSFQIREGSERIYVRNNLLSRNTDYTIDYTTGQVQFRNPDLLFQGGSGASQVRAQFEERAAFSIAPTTIYGLAAKYDLGAHGQVNLTGMFQNEQSAFTRPPLGFEPSSGFIGGVSTQLRFQPDWITRAVDALPGVRTTVPSAVTINGEVALSKPSPNRFGQAYIEEFEGSSARSIALADNAWHWGSIPTSVRGVEPLGIVGKFDPNQAAFLTWQSLPYNVTNGRYVPVQFLPQQIDPTVRLTGQAQSAEPVLWLMLKPDTALGLANNRPASPSFGLPNWVGPPKHAPRWRSITQSLSATGIDLSRVEFLEFWVWEDATRVARANGTTVLFDFGGVFEDALAFVPTSFTVSPDGDTTYAGVRRTGEGRLDTERDRRTGTWSAALNDEGILSDRIVDGILNSTSGSVIDTMPLCSATDQNGQLIPYAFGDIRSRCGRHNGAVDTEDLDGDFALDSVVGARTAESFVRYVFPVGDERFFVRDGGMVPSPGGAAGWRLYRIPFRQDTIQVGAPSLRQVQSLRITVVVPATPGGAPDPQVYFALSRVQLVGSTWVKRSDTPITGIGGERGTGIGEVIASVVSTDNRDLGYTPPPGVIDQAARRDASFQLTATEINEHSMRLLANGLGVGERAEAYLRFTTEGDKNFLKYRTLRVWARGRGPGWEDGDLEFFIKAGKDQDNFYMYHTPARTVSWEPEVVAQFDRWLALRARIERAWLSGDSAHVYPGCPDSTLVRQDGAFVMCDGPYIVHIRDPGTAPPNLARVQEIATGIWRTHSAVFVNQVELWIDDIRLGDVVRQTGAAGALDLTVAAADVADLALNVSRRGAQFRQLGADPSYVTDNAVNVSGTVRLDKFLPDRWGVSVPLTFQRIIAASAPFYLNGTDLRADALQGLRTPRATAATYAFAARRVRPGRGSLAHWLFDPVALSGSYSNGDTRSELSNATASAYSLNVDYNVAPAPLLLKFAGTSFRLNPSRIRFHSGVAGSDAERHTFLVPIPQAGDTARPSISRSRLWQNSGGVSVAPVTGLQLGVDLTSTRDLRDYGDSTTIGRLIRQQRTSLLGQNVGVETQRLLNASLSLTPQLGAWIRPRASVTSSFAFTRDPNARQPARTLGDTAGEFRIPAAFSNGRRLETGAQFDPRRLALAIFGDSSSVAGLFGRISGVDVSYSAQQASTFSRATDAPPLNFQLALGSLEAFRQVSGLLATSASQNTTLSTGGTVLLPLGMRAQGTYRLTTGVAWTLRSNDQVPLSTRTRDWPNGSLTWSVTPSRRLLGRLMSNFSARLGYRRTESVNEQPTFGGPANVALNSTVERNLTPSASITWIGGVFTVFDVTRTSSERVSAGNLFRNVHNGQNGTLSFSFRPPKMGRWRSNVRTTAGYSVANNTACLQRAGQTTCVPYVDSRQTQAQLTMDSDLPSNMSAGLQMAYVLNEERQTNRKISQFVITAFVQLSTSVGQIR